MSKDNNKTIAARKAMGVCLVAGAAFTPLAQADEFHYNNILIGDRAAGMGGAYTAVSDDPSGLYYNPAGITFAAGRNLSASVNAYQQTNTDYNNVLDGRGWHRRSKSILPNFFGVTQPAGKGVIGFSYAVPDAMAENQDQVFYNLPDSAIGVPIDRYVINFNHRDHTYQLGPSFAYPVSKRFSLGATLYGHYRERESSSNQLINLSNGQYEWTNLYDETHEYGIKPIIGAIFSPYDKLALGVSASKVFVLDSYYRRQTTFKGINYGGNDVIFDLRETDLMREHPFVVNFGVAAFPSDAFLISWDVTYNAAARGVARYYRDINQVVVFESDKEATWNTALGAEYYFTGRWALRGGVFTNRANTPVPQIGKSNQPEHIDMYGRTLSLSHFSGNSSTTFGVGYSQGSGKAQLFGGGSTTIQDVERKSLMVFLSASSSF